MKYLFGKLCLSKRSEYFKKFTKILQLKKYKIVCCYAGFSHSLFQTVDGRILSCGSNKCGELLLQSSPSDKGVFSPTETTIAGNATFCIAGCRIRCTVTSSFF